MKEKDYAIVSKILDSFGLKGEAKCSIETDILENITRQKGFYLRQGDKRVFMEVEYIKEHHNAVIIKFKGLDSPEAVKFFRGWFLEVSRDDLIPLEEGMFYRFELIGMKVYSTEGEFIGVIDDIMSTAARDVYVIKTEAGKEVLIPSAFVESIDKDKKEMVVRLIEGLVE
ncbi:MAG: 16S rRNA processing protein RimM [Deferribacteres bacterium]|nr:16S rRNA processing protein RimM [Deferribacteres bacterium]